MNNITYNNKYILKNEKPWFVIMGEFHYSRYPKAFWKKEIGKMKAGGLDIISTYVIWIHHEEIKGEYDFEGNKDLRAFCEACKECDVNMFLRIGPWIHGEVRNGGFPDWLVNEYGDKARTNDEGYLFEVEKFYKRIYSEVEGMFLKDGGPIIGVQIENEYGHCGGLSGDEGEKHMKTLYEMAKRIGFEVPLYTATGWGGAVTGGLLPVMGGYCDAPWAQCTDKLTPSQNYVITHERNDHGIGADHHIGYGVTFDYEKFPYLTAELGGGLQVTAHRRPVAQGKDIGAMSLTKLASGVNLLGYYMYHGGTNPKGKLTTLQESTATGYLNDLPEYCYDFNAPLKEYGQVTDTFKEIKLLAMFTKDFGEEFCKMDTYISPDVSEKPENLSDLRWSVRKNGDSGYIFVNNYQRLYKMAEHCKKLKVDLPDGEIEFPEITIRDGDYFFYPFNMKIGDATIRYCTATPLCKLNDETIFFYYDKPVECAVDSGADIRFITREEAKNAYKLYLHQEHLAITNGVIIQTDKSCEIYANEDISFKVYPDFDMVPFGFEKLGVSDGFGVYRKKIDTKSESEFELVSDENNVKRYRIDVDATECEECYVNINYQGNKARVYVNGELVDDDFFTGFGFTVGLARFGFPKSFEVEIYPLYESDDIYLEVEPRFKNSIACEIESIEVLCEQKVDIDFTI